MGSAAAPTGRLFIAWLEGRGEDVNRLLDEEVRPVEADVFSEMADAGAAWVRLFAATSDRRVDDVASDICRQEQQARHTRRTVHRKPDIESNQELVHAFLVARTTGDDDAVAALSPQVLDAACWDRLGIAVRFALAAFERCETIPGTSREQLVLERWPILDASEIGASKPEADGLWMRSGPVERLDLDDEALLLAVFMRVLSEIRDEEALRHYRPPYFAVGRADDDEGTWLVIATGFGTEAAYGWDGSITSAITYMVGAADAASDDPDEPDLMNDRSQ